MKDEGACMSTGRMISCSDNEVCQMTTHHRDGRSEMYQFCVENFKLKLSSNLYEIQREISKLDYTVETP